jgi:NitT/TauT family transport system permease protein
MTTGRRLARTILPPLLTLVLTTLAAEVLIRVLHVSSLVLPRPSEVAVAAWMERATLGPALAGTTGAVALGLFLSAVVGLVIAVVLSASRWVQRAFYPYSIFFQIVPVVAIAPLLVIWFGYGIKTVVAAAFIVSIFPVIANTLAGLLSVDPAPGLWRRCGN